MPSWFAVRCVFRTAWLGDGPQPEEQLYEERITLWQASSPEEAIALAEQEAAEWQAGQEAHLYERQFRLMQTSRVALPMLQKIALTGGNLTEEDRQECFHLEGALRDEIRGRRLLNDAVRAQIMILRRRGTAVSLLDDGGVDE
ncbi:MAG: putative integral rane protein, partial [Frankiales bacterium]|nr:putative integral rane protein [Frankiales bacterium]